MSPTWIESVIAILDAYKIILIPLISMLVVTAVIEYADKHKHRRKY
jgi:hypothetical protein